MSHISKTSLKSGFASSAVRGGLFSLALILSISSAQAATRTIRFQNKTGQDVDDLHIETKQGVTITEMSPFDGDRGTDGANKHNLWGATVPKEPVGGPPNEATVKMSSTSNEIVVKKWWWTSGGTARADGRRVGDIHTVDDGGKVLACYDGVAQGDGLIYVCIDSHEGYFQTQRGAPAELTAMMFNEFLEQFWDDTFDLIHNVPLSRNEILLAGNVVGNPETQMYVEMLQRDSGLNLELRELDRGPELSISGNCPGPVTATISNCVPGTAVDVFWGINDAQATQAPGCPGVLIAFGNAHYLGRVTANNQGVATMRGNAPQSACGKVLLQAIEQARCLPSSLARL